MFVSVMHGRLLIIKLFTLIILTCILSSSSSHVRRHISRVLKLDVTASSTFQMLLSQSTTQIPTVELETLKNLIATQLLRWEFSFLPQSAAALYGDIEIVSQDVEYKQDLLLTSIRFFVLATSRNTEDDEITGNSTLAQEQRNDLNQIVIDAFATESFVDELIDRIHEAADDEQLTGLRSIQDIEVFLVAPAPNPSSTTPEGEATVARRRFSVVETVLVVVSVAIFVGVVYMIIQHHIDQGYFENERIRTINSQQLSFDPDGVDDATFTATLLSTVRAEDKGDSENPSTPSTIESILREEDHEFMVPQPSTPPRQPFIVQLVREEDIPEIDMSSIPQARDDNVVLAHQEASFQVLPEEVPVRSWDTGRHDGIADLDVDSISTEGSMLSKDDDSYGINRRRRSIIEFHLDDMDRIDPCDFAVRSPLNAVSTNIQTENVVVPVETQIPIGIDIQEPTELSMNVNSTQHVSVSRHLESYSSKYQREPIIVETVTSLSSGYSNSTKPTMILSEAFDGEWFLDTIQDQQVSKRAGNVVGDDCRSTRSNVSIDYFGIDVAAATTAAEPSSATGSQSSKESKRRAITEWISSLQVRTRATSTGTSIMSNSGSTDPKSLTVRRARSYGREQDVEIDYTASNDRIGNNMTAEDDDHQSSSSSGISSSFASSSGLYDSASTSLSSLDRISITHSMASSGNGVSDASSSSSSSSSAVPSSSSSSSASSDLDNNNNNIDNNVVGTTKSNTETQTQTPTLRRKGKQSKRNVKLRRRTKAKPRVSV